MPWGRSGYLWRDEEKKNEKKKRVLSLKYLKQPPVLHYCLPSTFHYTAHRLLTALQRRQTTYYTPPTYSY